jgi:hypothetical protein
LVALTTREIQRLALMARIFLSVSVLAGTRHIVAVVAYLRLLVVMALPSSIDICMSWSERGVGSHLVV